ncbi:hypothetical protein ALP64_202470 [Pseudomonas syringae pv. actinidiae]|nr:hypothetical protein ALP64_202470 [Pseudomonas syringae pv. actinidiae]
MVEPGHLFRLHSPPGQLECQRCEIRLQDLWSAIAGHLLVLRLRPQAVADTWLQAACPPRTLGSTGLRDTLRVESGHSTAGIELRHSLETTVHHDPNAFDGQAGLGDVRGQYDLPGALGCRVDSSTLGVQVEVTVQRAHDHLWTTDQLLLEVFRYPPNLCLPREENQNASQLFIDGGQAGVCDSRIDSLARLIGTTPNRRDRIHPPFTGDHRRIIQHL